MPGLGRYPCSSCHYVAGNRRMLARHAVLIHSEKVFKCPVCPFITRYAANWYRHKRDLHGLTKVTNCEVCGFFANSTAELAHHKETEHPEHLQLEKYEDKYAKEKIRLGGSIEEPPLEPIVVVEEVPETPQLDQPVSENSSNSPEDTSFEEEKHDSITFSLPLNGLLDANGDDYTTNGVEETSSHRVAMSDAGLTTDALRPLKVKRSYNCNLCGLLTSNPREYLYHLQSSHGEKISVFECKYCIYASKHVQKLHRHCNLVHRQLIAKDPDYQKQLEASKEKRARPGMNKPGTPLTPSSTTVSPALQNANPTVFSKPAIRNRPQPLFKCSTCPYQTRNKGFLNHHEKTVHLKRKFYRCLQCGYFTNEKARYTKHIKYHSLPKMQCEFCFFKTAYKWNMDRHMKNHENGAEGAFHCTACNFTTATKQSFKSHVTNHHNNESVEDFVDQDGDDMNGPDDSAEWEDMEEPETEEGNVSQPDENASMESYEFSEPRETTESVWKDGKVYQKTLQCSFCDFKAAWPFELKKHEENHKSQKKHPCPLCGMRFEHIAWLTKHLRRVHQENSQAKNIAAAFDLLKPTRRRPGKEYAADTVLPMFQEVLKQNNVATNKSQENKSSMLSTLLNKPLQPFMPTSINKFNSTFKSKTFAAASNMSRQLRISNYYDKTSGNESASVLTSKSKTVPTCNVCGYKTRWISELQRHMRVHSQEKPFHCPKCKYHCKWKGDLNRHLMKYHGIKVPSSGKKHAVPRLKLRKMSDPQNIVSDFQSQSVNQENRRKFVSSTPSRNPDQDGPLDLTLTKDTFPNYSNSDEYDPYDFESFSAMGEEPIVDIETVSENDSALNFKSPLQHLREPAVPEGSPSSVSTKRKYQCPFCTFGTTTASRFHVHIVQHYNRRPFMCSVCGYNSNWEWDITKHIRLKGCRDEFHNKACVLLTDETGRRNYEKYEKYLVDINEPAPAVSAKPPEAGNSSEPDSRYGLNRSLQNEPPKTCSYDFRNIGSNFEDTPENIVVTPDINIADAMELEMPHQFYGNQPADVPENPNIGEKSFDAKWFFCKHCNFKHATKRVVISHLSVHAGIKPFRCRACGITSNWRHVIVRHVKDAHNGYMNEVEDRISYVQEGFALRLTSINTSNPDANTASDKAPAPQFGCKICPYKCDKEFYIKSHMKQHRPREGAIYRCDYCPYFVKFKKTLVRHTKLHCPSTDSTVNESMDADEVSFNHSNIGDPQSDVYEFYDPQMNDSAEDSIAISFDTLNQYSNTETVSPQKIKRHVCESCPYKTDNKTQYLYHKQFHRPNPTAPFKCTVCTYWATMQHLLTQHMKVHSESEGESEQSPSKNKDNKMATAEKLPMLDDDWAEKMSVIYVKRGDLVVKMFKCKFCPMMNKKKANVRVHQKMHGVVVNNGKFACSYCDYQCLNQGGLTNHLKIHQKVPEKEAYIQPKETSYDASLKKADPSADDAFAPRKKFFSYFCMKCPALFKSSNDLEIHSKFHGSSLPFACCYCDYRARHKPHLSKHLTVHTPEYESKRNASQGPPVGFENENSLSSDPMLAVTEIPLVKKIDQMLLLEASEMSSALKKTGEVATLLQKCVFCPAAFFKTSTLSYHISLHGSEGEFKCTQCDYAVNRSANLTIHSQVHPRKKPPVKPKKAPLRSFPCPSCPAVFYKQDRYERHLNLHGKNYRFACQHCDYSVRFAANLIKHRALHASIAAKEKADLENVSSPTTTPSTTVSATVSPAAAVVAQPLVENTNILETDEKKMMYICDRCPYFQCRKDAVQSHQRRHWLKDGFKCPYCDYTSMQSGFVQSHIKMHIQPHQLFPAQAFMKYESFKIFSKDDDGAETLLFDDQEMTKEKHSESYFDKKKRRKNDDHERRKIRKLSSDFGGQDSNSSDFISKLKVPVVVLSDILSNEKDLQRWAPKLKIPKLKITKCSDSSSEKIYSKINISYDGVEKSSSSTKSKPSLVVKISKVEKCNKHEKPMYSVSTKTSIKSELASSSISKQVESNENSNDSALQESNATLNTPISADSFDDNTPVQDKDVVDDMEIDKVNNGDVSEIGKESSETQCPSDANNDLKCDDSFSDTVPENVDNCVSEKLSVLSELSYKQDLFLTNGENDSHLMNGLLPDEIEMKL